VLETGAVAAELVRAIGALRNHALRWAASTRLARVRPHRSDLRPANTDHADRAGEQARCDGRRAAGSLMRHLQAVAGQTPPEPLAARVRRLPRSCAPCRDAPAAPPKSS